MPGWFGESARLNQSPARHKLRACRNFGVGLDLKSNDWLAAASTIGRCRRTVWAESGGPSSRDMHGRGVGGRPIRVTGTSQIGKCRGNYHPS